MHICAPVGIIIYHFFTKVNSRLSRALFIGEPRKQLAVLGSFDHINWPFRETEYTKYTETIRLFVQFGLQDRTIRTKKDAKNLNVAVVKISLGVVGWASKKQCGALFLRREVNQARSWRRALCPTISDYATVEGNARSIKQFGSGSRFDVCYAYQILFAARGKLWYNRSAVLFIGADISSLRNIPDALRPNKAERTLFRSALFARYFSYVLQKFITAWNFAPRVI
jgi:hypothetical protein